MKKKDSLRILPLILFLLFSLLFLSGCASTKQKMLDAGFKPLTTYELQSLFTEKRIAKYYNTEKQQWTAVTFLPNGSQATVSNGKVLTGVYNIENDQYCSTLSPNKGDLRCTTWFKVSDKTYDLYQVDGSKAGELTFE